MKRCTFCAQGVQTGVEEISEKNAVARVSRVLDDLEDNAERCELAFYGGTFTMLPRNMQLECLKVATSRKRNITVRCSTRPDALEPEWLCRLKQEGVTTIELGIQSFDSNALSHVQRDYDQNIARKGCELVKKCGLTLGVQLMPGMPGVTPEIFLRDVAMAIACGADFMRFYPCLVFEGTALAETWRNGGYKPWSLELTIAALGKGLAMAWKAGVPVVRIGVAAQDGVSASMLDGPWHASLGSHVQAEALTRTVEGFARDRGKKLVRLVLPKRVQGYMGGCRAKIWERWKNTGVPFESLCWWDETHGLMEYHAADVEGT